MPQVGFCCKCGGGELVIDSPLDIIELDVANGGWTFQDFGRLEFFGADLWTDPLIFNQTLGYKSDELADDEEAQPVRYTYTPDLTRRWNVINTRWYYNGSSEWMQGSLPETHPLRPRRILTAHLAIPSASKSQVNRYRIWVNGVDTTGIVNNPWDPHTHGQGEDEFLPLPITFANSYEHVQIEVDIWYINTSGAAAEIVLHNMTARILFLYELRDIVTTRSVDVVVSTGESFTTTIDLVHPTFERDDSGGDYRSFAIAGTAMSAHTTSIPANDDPPIETFWFESAGNFPTVGLWDGKAATFAQSTEQNSSKYGPVQGTVATATVTPV